MNYVIQKIRKINGHIDTYISKEAGFVCRISIFGKLLLDILLEGVHLDEFFQYRFYKISRKEKKKYITFGRRRKIQKVCNIEEGRRIFDQKPLFNARFSAYLERDYLDLTECSQEDFLAFAGKHKKAFVKSPNAFFGIGTDVISLEGDLPAIYRDLQRRGLLMEELIDQEESIAAFHPQSVNTLRVVTILRASGEAVIKGTCIRFGTGEEIADNFHHNGIAALVDVDTGHVITDGVNRFLEIFETHPDSGLPIRGFAVPAWDRIREKVLAAAQEEPRVRYAGWDVALTRDGRIAIIEGNQFADPDILQIPDGKGKWELFKYELEALKRSPAMNRG